MKKILLIFTAILLMTLLIGCCEKDDNVDNKENNTTINNENLNKHLVTYIDGEKALEPLTFSNIKILDQGENKNLLTATVTNNSSGDILSKVLDIELFKENNKTMGIVGAILPDVSAFGTVELRVPIALNVMDTKDIEIRYTGN